MEWAEPGTTKDNEKSESLKMVELKSIEYDKSGTEYEWEERSKR